METLRHIQTSGTFAYFPKSCTLLLLQDPFTKQVTSQGPIVSRAKYFQKSAQVPSQRDLGSKVLFGIRLSFKEVSGFPLMFRNVDLSAAKPSLQDFLLTALSSLLPLSDLLNSFLSLCRKLHHCTQGSESCFKSCLSVSKSHCSV